MFVYKFIFTRIVMKKFGIGKAWCIKDIFNPKDKDTFTKEINQ